jgi:hypothetical protein
MLTGSCLLCVSQVSAFTLFMRCMVHHKRELVNLMAQLDTYVKL